jgi:hypothetical protein
VLPFQTQPLCNYSLFFVFLKKDCIWTNQKLNNLNHEFEIKKNLHLVRNLIKCMVICMVICKISSHKETEKDHLNFRIVTWHLFTGFL